MKKKFNGKGGKKGKKAAKMSAAREPGSPPGAPVREEPPVPPERQRDVLHDAARKAGIFLPGGNRRG